MNHRRGQRWQTDLAIRIVVEQTPSLLQARLQDLSYHGARVWVHGCRVKPGKTIVVWLPKMDAPIRALVVHRRDDSLGLLWIEHSPWVEHTLLDILRQAPQSIDDPASVQHSPGLAPKTSVGFGVQPALSNIAIPHTQRRA